MKEFEYSNPDEETKYKKNASVTFSIQPLIGLWVSTFSAFLMLLLRREWSPELVFYTLIPLTGSLLIYLLAFISLRKILDINFLVLKGKIRYLTIFLTMVFVTLEIMIFVLNPKFDFETINLDNIETIETRISIIDSSKYYIIYGAENCLYCKSMKDTYSEAFRDAKIQYAFYCDISDDSYSDERLIDLGINKIPIVVGYQKGKEVSRLEGVRDVEDVKEFLKK